MMPHIIVARLGDVGLGMQQHWEAMAGFVVSVRYPQPEEAQAEVHFGRRCRHRRRLRRAETITALEHEHEYCNSTSKHCAAAIYY